MTPPPRDGRLTRRGAIPAPVLKPLQDRSSVAALDGEAHRHRKAMLPAQDLRIDLSKAPAAPGSRLVIDNVRACAGRAAG